MRIHAYIPGSDFALCGACGPSKKFSQNLREVDCGNCKRSFRFTKKGIAEIHYMYIDTCSGCHETVNGHAVGDYGFDEKAGIKLGVGCHECGYTGKRRHEGWIPVGDLNDKTQT